MITFGKLTRLPMPPRANLVYGNPDSGKALVYTPPDKPGSPYLSWPFYEHNGQRHTWGAVHVFTIYKTDDGTPMVYFIRQKRPPMGGLVTVECPGGKYGDLENGPNETVEAAAVREAKEETGFNILKVQQLAENEFSPALSSNEQKSFAMVLAEKPKGKAERILSGEELDTMQDTGISVPLADVLNPDKFSSLLRQWEKQGLVPGIDIAALRGLLPSKTKMSNFLDITA